MRTLSVLCASALLAGLFGPLAAAVEPAACRKIRMAEIGWADITATNAVTSVLAEGLGYQPRTMMASVPIAFTGVRSKQIDLFLGYWSPSMDPIIEPFRASNGVRVLPTPNLVGAKYTLAVPRYAFDAGLRSFTDIVRFKEPLQGRIYAIEPGNEGNGLIASMIKEDRFGLGDFSMVESSESGMLVQVQRAIRAREPVVFLAWEPHPMNNRFDIVYLDGGDQVFGPDHGAARVFTVVPTDLETRCPNLARLFANLRFDVGMENQWMERLLDKQAPRQVALTWLRANPDILGKWLDGVRTHDGKDGVAAVRAHLGLP